MLKFIANIDGFGVYKGNERIGSIVTKEKKFILAQGCNTNKDEVKKIEEKIEEIKK